MNVSMKVICILYRHIYIYIYLIYSYIYIYIHFIFFICIYYIQKKFQSTEGATTHPATAEHTPILTTWGLFNQELNSCNIQEVSSIQISLF